MTRVVMTRLDIHRLHFLFSLHCAERASRTKEIKKKKETFDCLQLKLICFTFIQLQVRFYFADKKEDNLLMIVDGDR
jgi:uncharacterized membrane protein YfhO